MPTSDDPSSTASVPVPEETLQRLAAADTATLTACLQRRGITNAYLEGLHPVGQRNRFVGRARTLRYLPARADLLPRYGGERSVQRAAVESIEPGEVLVISARSVLDAGTIGDLYALRVAKRGGVGVVSDGAVRDATALAALELPIFAAAAHGATLMRRHVAIDLQVPVACAEVTVFPGDLIVADADGVVCVPQTLASEVADEATGQRLEEEFAEVQLRAGAACSGYFPLSPQRRAEFETWLRERPDNGGDR